MASIGVNVIRKMKLLKISEAADALLKYKGDDTIKLFAKLVLYLVMDKTHPKWRTTIVKFCEDKGVLHNMSTEESKISSTSPIGNYISNRYNYSAGELYHKVGTFKRVELTQLNERLQLQNGSPETVATDHDFEVAAQIALSFIEKNLGWFFTNSINANTLRPFTNKKFGNKLEGANCHQQLRNFVSFWFRFGNGEIMSLTKIENNVQQDLLLSDSSKRTLQLCIDQLKRRIISQSGASSSSSVNLSGGGSLRSVSAVAGGAVAGGGVASGGVSRSRRVAGTDGDSASDGGDGGARSASRASDAGDGGGSRLDITGRIRSRSNSGGRVGGSGTSGGGSKKQRSNENSQSQSGSSEDPLADGSIPSLGFLGSQELSGGWGSQNSLGFGNLDGTTDGTTDRSTDGKTTGTNDDSGSETDDGSGVLQGVDSRQTAGPMVEMLTRPVVKVRVRNVCLRPKQRKWSFE